MSQTDSHPQQDHTGADWDEGKPICEGCGHPEIDCICDFLRDEWPTHFANPEAVERS